MSNLDKLFEEKFSVELTEEEGEGRYAKKQIENIIEAAEEILYMMMEEEDLPSWVQNKITIAEHNLHAIADYLSGAEEEENDDADDRDQGDYPRYFKEDLDESTMPWNEADKLADKHAAIATKHKKLGNTKAYLAHADVSNYITDRLVNTMHPLPVKSAMILKKSSSVMKMHPLNESVDQIHEETEQLDEISSSTLKSYIAKADKSMDKLDKQMRKSTKIAKDDYFSAASQFNNAKRKADNAENDASRRKAEAEYNRAQKKLARASEKSNIHTDIAHKLSAKIGRRFDSVEKAHQILDTRKEEK